jgi:hypothetical protein
MSRNPMQINAVQELRTVAGSGYVETVDGLTPFSAVSEQATHVEFQPLDGVVWLRTDGGDAAEFAGFRVSVPVVLPVTVARQATLWADGVQVWVESKIF